LMSQSNKTIFIKPQSTWRASFCYISQTTNSNLKKNVFHNIHHKLSPYLNNRITVIMLNFNATFALNKMQQDLIKDDILWYTRTTYVALHINSLFLLIFAILRTC
jgi:hypothetical protein